MGCESFAKERCDHALDNNGRSVFETPELHRALTPLLLPKLQNPKRDRSHVVNV